MPISWQPADPRCRKHLASANRVGLALAGAGGRFSLEQPQPLHTRGASGLDRMDLEPGSSPAGAEPRQVATWCFQVDWPAASGSSKDIGDTISFGLGRKNAEARGSRTLRDASVGGRHWRKAISTSDGNRSSSRALKKSGSKVCIRYSGRRRPAQMLGDCEDDGERGRKQ